MKTITILIGNSDNKLDQFNWSEYCQFIDNCISDTNWSSIIHFSGFSLPNSRWQNGCWVFGLDDSKIDGLKRRLSNIAKRFDQDSIAFVVGETFLVEPA